MKIKNLKIGVDAIATGIYAMICERGEEEIVAFGMIPVWAIEALENGLRKKIISEAAKQVCCNAEEIKAFIDEDLVKEIIRAVTHEVILGIYSAAKKNRKLYV